ncbi:hypothetical protein HNP86_001071 [Methanococcus maripaludis]|uniref:Uncharacterized protein n=1 Tax=Methanococcus maripaludis TaxID=39152 RepID=A0A7J9NTE2_METMI|nr:hypothetical protein [Methanococcus maripaludis]MBA2846500.1 hypothetical protein [Methanococcus maripaludis]MBA2850940.1 hypothetical protein [Methanococcus maripaludis]
MIYINEINEKTKVQVNCENKTCKGCEFKNGIGKILDIYDEDTICVKFNSSTMCSFNIKDVKIVKK